MKNIVYNDIILARHILIGDVKKGLSFFSENEEFIQVGSWDYDEGKQLLAHYHNEYSRVVTRTCEVLVVLNGKVEASIYNLSGELVDRMEVNAGEVLVLLECAHGYKVLEDSTRVIEIKNGPYFGPEIDRTRIEK